MAVCRVWILWALLSVAVLSFLRPALAEEGGAGEVSSVLTLDASNFSETVSKHPFIVVEFNAPWCGHCKRLAPEYEKAASILSKHDPPVVLAKIDANDGVNKELASKYEIKGFPTLKILRNEGKDIQEYKGPRDADGIAEYLKKQVGPASNELKSSEDAGNLIRDKIFIVGVFPEFSGEEFENFMKVAEKSHSEYDFGHTSDAKLLPRGDPTVKQPTVRLFKPFDELFVDFQDFHVDSLEKFIKSASIPILTTFNRDPSNHPFVMKFFNSPNAKAMLFMNFNDDYFDALKSKFHENAVNYKGKNMSFLIADVDASQGAFQFYGLKKDQVPLMIIQENGGKKFLQSNVAHYQIDTMLVEYVEGKLKPYRKSLPVPEVNNEPVKTVVANNIHEVVFNSGKNVLLEFYAPWCRHCKKLAPTLHELAVTLENDTDVIIAKMDATANDIPDEFEIKGYPTLYFSSASDKLLKYDGDRTAESIYYFILHNRDSISQSDSIKEEL